MRDSCLLEASKLFKTFSSDGYVLTPSDFETLCSEQGVAVSRRQCISAVRCLGTKSNQHLDLKDVQRWWRYGTAAERMARVALSSLELEKLEVCLPPACVSSQPADAPCGRCCSMSLRPCLTSIAMESSPSPRPDPNSVCVCGWRLRYTPCTHAGRVHPARVSGPAAD